MRTAGALLAVLLASQPALASTPEPVDAPHPGQVVHVGGFVFVVPQPGSGVSASVLLAKGGERSAGVTTLRDGTVVVRSHAVRPDSESAAATPVDACEDGAYAFNNSKWERTYRWRFRARSVPSGVKRISATKAIRRAASTIVTGRNDCGMPDRIRATQQYLGKTAAKPNIDSTSNCTTPDGKSVIGFGQLAPSDLGLTCWWTLGGGSVEADIVFNSSDYGWATRFGSGCTNDWSVQAVATHELGHAFGLDHVAPVLHGNQTMSPVITPCQSSQATLGRGDVLGLRAKY